MINQKKDEKLECVKKENNKKPSWHFFSRLAKFCIIYYNSIYPLMLFVGRVTKKKKK